MSKRSEEAAMKAYPKEEGKVWTSAFGKIEFDRNAAERRGFQEGYEQAEKETIEVENMVSPFTGGKVIRGMDTATINFHGEDYTVPHKFYQCVDTGNRFADTPLDEDNIWEVIKAYFNRKEVNPFHLVNLYEGLPVIKEMRHAQAEFRRTRISGWDYAAQKCEKKVDELIKKFEDDTEDKH